jgi:L-lactate dehydrogenase complex protein LldF
MTENSGSFGERIHLALDNAQVRSNFRSAMTGVIANRARQFPDDDSLQARREQSSQIRGKALRRLPALLRQLEERLIENGITVHWAADAEEANQAITCILAKSHVKKVVKGKSMVSEEIGMNAYLEQRGIQVIESDLGEFIIQLAGETPSHIVMPAVHKNRREISELFQKHIEGAEYTEDVDELTALARKELRYHFETADAGISGVNFMVAESGTLVLIENEGNGRLSTTSPPLHIAVTGIEKVVEKLTDLAPLLDILPKSATGQPITTYVNMISSPRKAGELDGPQRVHLVLVDNGRSAIQTNERFLDTLKCIRCGACINHCPVYVQIGGHAYGTTYPGPIGTVLEPQKQGMGKAGDLLSACTLCGRCGEVCPVKIPLPEMINELRHESVRAGPAGASHVKQAGALKRWRESLLWSLWAQMHERGFLYRSMCRVLCRFRAFTPGRIPGWSDYRKTPKLARRSLHQLLETRDEVADE